MAISQNDTWLISTLLASVVIAPTSSERWIGEIASPIASPSQLI